MYLIESFAIFLTLAIAEPKPAAEPIAQPFIDEVKQSLGPEAPQKKGQGSHPYIDKIKGELESREPPQENTDRQPFIESVIESIKETEPLAGPTRQPLTSYTAEEKKKLLSQKPIGSLQPIVKEDIRQAFGLQIATVERRNVTATEEFSAHDFRDIYPTQFVPDLALFYHYHPFHSEVFGNVSLVARFGLTFFNGTGLFTSSRLSNPVTGQTFSQVSKTKLRLVSLPAVLGASLRFNLLKYLRPYITAGPAFMLLIETRDDGGDTKRALARSLYTAIGVSLLLDWVSADSRWHSYAEFGIQHTYFIIEYIRYNPLASPIRYESSGVYAGFSFEF